MNPRREQDATQGEEPPAHHRTVIGQEQRERTRARIIDSALHVFAVKGADMPVVDDFIRAAGVSRGTFYNYFTTTQQLLEATVETVSDELIEAIFPFVKDMDNPVLRFATAARVYYKMAAGDPVFCAFLAGAVSAGSLGDERVRFDLLAAMDQGLIQCRNLEIAFAATVGTMGFSLKRLSQSSEREVPCNDVIRAMLRSVGASDALIDEALRIRLPRIARPARKFD